MEIKIFRLTKDAKIPVRAHEDDVGYDLHTVTDFILPSRSFVLARTGLKVSIPKGWEIQIRPKSGLASRGITILNTPGTIDAGYRGEVLVLLHNTTVFEFEFLSGEKIAQMVIKPVYDMEFIDVEEEKMLGETDRGERGFGSTGD